VAVILVESGAFRGAASLKTYLWRVVVHGQTNERRVKIESYRVRIGKARR
jgi:hypothetical protein